MSALVEPLVFVAGVNKFGVDDDGWTLVEAPADGQERQYRGSIAFEQALRSVPVVHLGIVGFDVDNQDAARLRVRAENITAQGFDVLVETWLHSKIWSVDVSWLAIGT